MGVPAFFRWLQRKYPTIVVDCKEDRSKNVDDSQPNPNGYEFDNLYLDMNGIIHPCSHPEDKPAPKNEAEMMVAIVEYIDRLFSICRPRRLLYMAIDGVAPRAKMNQQRSRRFRSAKESRESRAVIARIKAELRAKGARLPPEETKEHFDSNCITPGTEFMDRLSVCLRYYITDRVTNHPGWKNIKVILSDANVPGEGEHKIMDYIRRQRAQPNHDPNTKHCLNGADADLIMLGLATHEAHFTIIREEFIPNQPKPCEICALVGHEKEECQGLPEKGGGKPFIGNDVNFIFIHLPVLREYLERELKIDGLPFKYEFDRVLDDWVFMCFFVGNDFLPHLPSLDIREGGIDKLVSIYKQCLPKMGGYLAENGYCNLKRVQTVLTELGKMEDEIFRKRQESEAPDLSNLWISPVRTPSSPRTPNSDNIRLWESGWKGRYYYHKFGVSREKDPALFKEFTLQVGNEYVLGLAWVLLYYYQGCPSWNWFYPFHYAPFASDFLATDRVDIRFKKGSEPFKPLEQLMSVFPAASGKFLPPTWQDKMCNPDSEIIDFYPNDFRVDLNGKRWAWQGVALLPFVDEKRLHRTLAKVYGNLTDDEKRRNRRDAAVLFVGKGNPMFDYLIKHTKSKPLAQAHSIATEVSKGMGGNVYEDKMAVPHGSVYPSPLPNMPNLRTTTVLSVRYIDPSYDINHVFLSVALKNAVPPQRTLKQNKNYNSSSNVSPGAHQYASPGSPSNRLNSSQASSGSSCRGSPQSQPCKPPPLLSSPVTPPRQLMRQSSPYNSCGINSPSPHQYLNNAHSPILGNQSFRGNQSFNSPQSPYSNYNRTHGNYNCSNNQQQYNYQYLSYLLANQSKGTGGSSGRNQSSNSNQLFTSALSPYGNNSNHGNYRNYNFNSHGPRQNSNQHLRNLSPLLSNQPNPRYNPACVRQLFGDNQSYVNNNNRMFNSPQSPSNNRNYGYYNFNNYQNNQHNRTW